MFKKLIIAIFSLAMIASCTKKKSSTAGMDIKDTLRVNVTTEPPSLDWNKSSDTTSAKIQDNIMEGLIKYDLKDPELSLLPGLAASWTPSENTKVWTFKLRENVKWNDGVAFTAQHVLDGWERLLNPLTASNYAYFLHGLEGAEDYTAGKIKDFSKVGVKLLDANTIQVTLKGPQSYFPNLLTHHTTYPIRKDIVEKHGDTWTEPENIVTLGAYKMTKWIHDKEIHLVRSENYYGEKAKIKNVVAYMINENSTAINLFEKGQLDMQLSLPSTELRELKKKPEYKDSGLLGIYYYGFNTQKAPMDNATVRRAIAHAVDRQAITKMLAGGQIPTTGFVPAGMFGYDASIGTGFDVTKAKMLFDEAGYSDRSKFPTIKIGFNTNEDHQRVAENVQAQLKKNLGINVELYNEEWKVFLKSVKTDPPHMYRMGWIGDYPDPDNFLNLVTSASANNYTKWKSPTYDKLIADGAVELNKEKRKGIYKQAQKLLLEEAVALVPIYNYVSQDLISDRVVNFKKNPMDRYPFKDLTLK